MAVRAGDYVSAVEAGFLAAGCADDGLFVGTRLRALVAWAAAQCAAGNTARATEILSCPEVTALVEDHTGARWRLMDGQARVAARSPLSVWASTRPAARCPLPPGRWRGGARGALVHDDAVLAAGVVGHRRQQGPAPARCAADRGVADGALIGLRGEAKAEQRTRRAKVAEAHLAKLAT
ncbi:hypothetical protein Aglo01_36330 [Actinokineospora globicatena]|nr:hypothetical protein Aglo01_36330 [Actinokineospora globicatena]GLW86439.1 hypothetical protein Aglo02_40780 [Actinokineospora globicatena]